MTTAHEPPRGPDVHLSAEDLSAAAEGAQPVAEGASEHLAGCAECGAQVDTIGRLLTALETMDRPRIPQDVAIRIDAALTREAMARARSSDALADARFSSSSASSRSASNAISDITTPTRTSSSAAHRQRRLSRGFGWGLASLAAVAGGLALAVNLTSSHSTEAGSSGSAALHPYSSNNSRPQQAPGRFAAPTRIPSTSALASWVRQALAVSARPDTRINSACLTDPAFAGESPLRVVDSTYDGAPATLVVYADGGSSATVRAVVYERPCAPEHFNVLAQGIVAK